MVYSICYKGGLEYLALSRVGFFRHFRQSLLLDASHRWKLNLLFSFEILHTWSNNGFWQIVNIYGWVYLAAYIWRSIYKYNSTFLILITCNVLIFLECFSVPVSGLAAFFTACVVTVNCSSNYDKWVHITFVTCSYQMQAN